MTTPSFEPLSSALATFPAALPTLVILLKITCLLLAALGATFAMQRASAGSRHLVWLVVLGALLVLPPLAAWGPLHIRVLPEALAPATTSTPTESVADRALRRSDAVVPTSPQASSVPATPSRFTVTDSLGFASTLLAIWALVALGFAVRLVYGAWSVRRIVGGARDLEHPDWQTPLYQIADRLGLEAAPRLLQSDEVKMPFAAGLFSSRIVLPTESEEWSADRRSAVLIHELGHVRRRDLIGHTLSRIVCALYWFHPLVWTAARRLRAESERACDDLALVFGARPSDYAEHLLDIVTCVRDHNTPSVALAMAHRKEFEGRMLAVLNPELRRRGLSRVQTASLVGSLAVLALFVGAAVPAPRAPQSPGVSSPRQPEAYLVVTDTVHQPVVSAELPEKARKTSLPAAAARMPAAHPNPATPPALTPLQLATDTTLAGKSEDERVALLAKTLRTDANAPVRRVAAWGLHRYMRDEVAVQALAAAVGSDADATVREMSAWALAGAHRSPAASTALVKALQADKDPTVHATAVWALGSIGDEDAVEPLVGVLKDANPEVREMAAWSIGSCRPKRAPAALVSALSDKESDVRKSAAWALYTIRDPETAGAIEAAFGHETDHEVQLGLIRALGAAGESSVAALERLVSSPDAEIRTLAITALAGGDASGPWPWPRPEPRPFP